MIRDLIRKVASKTPGLRSVRNWDRRAANATTSAKSPPSRPSSDPLPGKERPQRVEPGPTSSSVATASPAAVPTPKAAPPPPTPPTSELAGGEGADSTATAPVPDGAAPVKRGGKRAARMDPQADGVATEPASAKPAKAAKAAEKKPTRPSARDEEAVEALRLEAEQRKAEIRARKEAEARAAAPAPTVGGIAARIAQSGGQVDQIAAPTGAVKAVNVWVPDDTEIHLAEDGVAYWGSVDNESARAYARGETLVIDQWECINCGTCVENTDHVFVLPMDAKAVVISQEGPMDLIQDAIDACPVTCIHWTDNPDQYEQINDAEGNPLH